MQTERERERERAFVKECEVEMWSGWRRIETKSRTDRRIDRSGLSRSGSERVLVERTQDT